MLVEARFYPPEELGRLAAACRRVGDGGAIRREFVKRMRVPVKQAAEDVKRTVRGIPVTASATWSVKGRSGAGGRGWGGARGGLRDGVARGVKVSVRTGGRTPTLTVRVDPSTLRPDQRTLPAHLNEPGGWRHPLFGMRSYWVHQRGQPYFEVTLMKHQPAYRAAVDQVATDIARMLGFTG